MLTHLLAFAIGAVLVWFLRRPSAPAATASPVTAASAGAGTDPMRAPDADLDADILEYVSDNQVFHINDICQALEHPKGSRFVRAHVHLLLEQGKIRYVNMTYRI